MAKKRVDIEVEINTLAWAASEATKLGISRRQYLSKLIERERIIMEGYKAQPSLENDGYIVKRPFVGIIPKARLIPKENEQT